MPASPALVFSPLPGVPPSLLGESPLWHPMEQVLYWCDIPGRALNRFDPARGRHDRWPVPSEPACCAPLHEGGLLVAMRDGLWRFDPALGARTDRIAAPPYDPAAQRFNDGKADPLGRLWVGTLDDARRAEAALYRHEHGRIDRMAGDITVSNGLAWSPDGGTLYWADTKSHTVFTLDFDLERGLTGPRRVFAAFAPRLPGQDIADYGGRPDGAAMDSQGGYWSAMFEGRRLVRLAPDGRQLAEIMLPVRCPTMPCFGGADLRTLYVTTARENRPADELAAEPWAGCVLQARVDVAGLPAHLARL